MFVTNKESEAYAALVLAKPLKSVNHFPLIG